MERIKLNLQEYGRMRVNPSVPQMLKGEDGEDGFSPIATVTKEGSVSTISITDKNGTTTATVSDGESDYANLENKPQINSVTLTGNKSLSDLGIAAKSDIPDVSGFYTKPANGIPGTDLADTYIEEPSSDGTDGQVLATDGDGGRYWKTVEGGGGGTSDYDDLENKPSINDVTLSGNKSASDLGLATPSDIPDVSGFYEKPSGGIPKTDLADAVQTSLGKADTALQSFTEIDPTVPSWAKAESKPTYTASEVGALPDDTVIPTKTSDLQNDSGFLTSAPVTSVNSKTGAVTLSASDVGAGTYSKPSGGIPSSDMTSAVQTSLGKADTAYQKPSGGIPSADLASGVIPDVSGKADKVSSPTSGNFAGLDANGNLTDSGHKHSDYLTSHQDISGKADKVSSATNGNFAGLDSNGNLTDSGSKASDFLTSAPVTDVQVNGSSVLSNGVANIPQAASNVLGVTRYASSSEIKTGTTTTRSIYPSKQHEATFYGLTKAAGVDMASSSNAVGVYTDAAKVAIQKMLGIYEAPWELIREDTFTNATEGTYIINVDGDGNAFELTDICLVLCFPTQNNEAKITNAFVYLNVGKTNSKQLSLENKTVSANSTPSVAYVVLEQTNGFGHSMFVPFSNDASTPNMRMKAKYDATAGSYPFYFGGFSITSLELRGITGTMNYRLYGRRKWT